MKNKFEINKLTAVVVLVSSLINVFVQYLNIDSYIKSVSIPFTVMLVGYLFLLHFDKNRNKKAYFLLIPIGLVLISNIFIKIDYSNMILNVIVLPILFSMFFFSLTNKNYKISCESLLWTVKMFFDRLFSNLKFIKFCVPDDKSKTSNIFKGIVVGGLFGIIILFLLMSADDYFKAFLGGISRLFRFDVSSIVIFILSFVFLFSIFVNILSNRNTKMKKITYKELNETMIITILSVINVVFVLFLVSEVSRLTNNFLQLPIEYTYSSYAREGFFQLLAVTVINFSIIIYLLYKSTVIKNSKTIRYLILILIAFSIVLICNSYYRMFLYIDNYGFTVLRLQVILFLAMELVLFGVLIKKIVKNLKFNDAIIYFVIIISFYIMNLYLCSNDFINLLTEFM